MHIDDLKLPGRKVLNHSQKYDYSPKRRWDEGSFGSQRAMLHNHVENSLREHQNDGDILDKFRKQAEQLKIKKRKQKFPHLYPTQSLQQNIELMPKIKSHSQYFPNQSIPDQKMEFQSSIRTIKPQKIQLSPQLIYAVDPIPNYVNQLESRLLYERVIARKDLQLYKREAKIKKQKNKIQNLEKELKKKEKEEQLERYLNYKDGISRINRALSDIETQLCKRKPKNHERKLTQHQNNQQIDRLAQFQNKNKSELYFKNQYILPILSSMSDRKKESYPTLSPNSLQKNPEVIYSPNVKKNKSNIFQNVSLFNPTAKISEVNGNLGELINYNKKLQHFHNINHQKLRKIQK